MRLHMCACAQETDNPSDSPASAHLPQAGVDREEWMGDKLQPIFDEYDLEGCGQITQHSFEAMVISLGCLPGKTNETVNETTDVAH